MKINDHGGVRGYGFRLFDFRSVRECVSNVLLICTAYTPGVNLTPTMPDYTIPVRGNYGIISSSESLPSRKRNAKSLSTLANN